MEKVLVTGGAGYKGIKLTARLLQQGFQVTIFDNFMYGYDSVLHLFPSSRLNVMKGDIRSGIDNLAKFDVIFHLAGISGFPACDSNPDSAAQINVDATRRLVASLGKGQILINASTTSMYGRSGEPCDENTPVAPVSTYARTKYEAEKIVADRANSVNLRFATIFGLSPKMRMDLMVNDFTYKAIKEGVLVLFDGHAKRTFMHVDDAAECYVFALRNFAKMNGGIYNAGGDRLNYSKSEIAGLIKQFVDFTIIDSDKKDRDLRHFIVNYSKIKSLGFVPRKTVEEGIEEMIPLFKFYEYYSHYRVI